MIFGGILFIFENLMVKKCFLMVLFLIFGILVLKVRVVRVGYGFLMFFLIFLVLKRYCLGVFLMRLKKLFFLFLKFRDLNRGVVLLMIIIEVIEEIVLLKL